MRIFEHTSKGSADGSRARRPLAWIPCVLATALVVSTLLGTVLATRAAGADDFRYLISLKTKSFIPAAMDYAPALTYLAQHQSEGSVHMMVQMTEIPSAETRLSLAGQGLVLQGYLPGRAYYALVSTKLTSNDLQAMGVRWLAPLEREDKISARVLNGEYGPWTQFENNWRIYAVQFHDDATMSQAEQSLSGVAKQIGGWIESTTTMILAMDPVQVDDVAQIDAVKYVDMVPPNLTQVNDDVRRSLAVDSLFTAPYNLDGTGSTVMEYDAGLADKTHPDFGGRVQWGESGSVIDHSTHVAGTVCGSGANSSGKYKGMAPGALLWSYEYEACSPNCLYNSPQDIEKNYRDGLNTHNADLVTNSIGANIAPNGYPCSWEGDYEQVSQLLDQISSGSLGAPFLSDWAAGNERGYGNCGTQYNTMGVPAGAKDIITVGATNSNDHSMTYFSSWGPVDDGRIKPDICAPGCQTNGDGGVTSTVPGGGYATMCGTSMATPTTSGCLATVLQQYRKSVSTARPLPSTLKALLINTAQDYGNTGPDYQFGYGEIRPTAAVRALRDSVLIRQGTMAQGGDDIYTVQLKPGQSGLKVTIAWDDPPGQYLANTELVNDLDLTITSPPPLGLTAYPWILDPKHPGNTATKGADHLNPVEQVEVPLAAPGIYTIHVKGYNVPQGPQAYSIVASAKYYEASGVAPQTPATPGAGIADLASYPNPFSPRTTIRFSVDGKAPISLYVFDASGRQVRTLLNNVTRNAGTQFVTWDGKDDSGRELSGGVYFYRVAAGNQTMSQKTMILR